MHLQAMTLAHRYVAVCPWHKKRLEGVDLFLLAIRGLFVYILTFLSSNWQDYMSHGSQGLFTQVGYSDRIQDDPSSQTHFGLGGQLSAQVFTGFLFSLYVLVKLNYAKVLSLVTGADESDVFSTIHTVQPAI